MGRPDRQHARRRFRIDNVGYMEAPKMLPHRGKVTEEVIHLPTPNRRTRRAEMAATRRRWWKARKR